jgi:hypothetical protein
MQAKAKTNASRKAKKIVMQKVTFTQNIPIQSREREHYGH